MTNRDETIKAAAPPLARDMIIQNRFGIHARPAALFIKTANGFQSEITVEKDGLKVSGKSIIGLMTLEGYQGAVLRVTAVGPDAAEALAALEELIRQKFFEE